MDISGTNHKILKFPNNDLRQQIKFEDDPNLAKMLQMTAGEVKKFEVFVTPLFDGFIGDTGFTPDLNERKTIISQLLNGLQQLKNAKKCHNDLKPSNILYRKMNNSYFSRLAVFLKLINLYSIQIADFGQCGGNGGTPGWTAPIFQRERRPGKEDMFSVGWLILRLLCDDENLFFCLRDNFVTDTTVQWMTDFRSLPKIQLIKKMINLENQPSVESMINEWNQIKPKVTLITKSKLIGLGVDSSTLRIQYVHSK